MLPAHAVFLLKVNFKWLQLCVTYIVNLSLTLDHNEFLALFGNIEYVLAGKIKAGPNNA